MEKLIVKLKSESYRDKNYTYEIGFDNLELKDMISTSGEVNIDDYSTLQAIKNQLLIDCGVVLFNHLKSTFPDIAKNYEL